MKKLLILILILVFGISIQGCSAGNSGNKSGGTTLQTTGTQSEVSQSETTQQTTAASQSETTQTDGKQTNATTSSSQENGTIIYKNTEYGFNFSLPVSWTNYKIIVDKWEGLAVGGDSGEKVVQTGPEILIRHPEWTAQKVRQDIPILVFTIKQWNSLQKDQFHIGAAPVGPSELGRNNKYVFALPARYNFAFPEGFEEVENILKGNPLQPFDIKG